jgi:hypothetical protein
VYGARASVYTPHCPGVGSISAVTMVEVTKGNLTWSLMRITCLLLGNYHRLYLPSRRIGGRALPVYYPPSASGNVVSWCTRRVPIRNLSGIYFGDSDRGPQRCSAQPSITSLISIQGFLSTTFFPPFWARSYSDPVTLAVTNFPCSNVSDSGHTAHKRHNFVKWVYSPTTVHDRLSSHRLSFITRLHGRLSPITHYTADYPSESSLTIVLHDTLHSRLSLILGNSRHHLTKGEPVKQARACGVPCEHMT